MHVAVLGDAGCGKTNLIRALVGLEYEDDSPPTEARTSYTQMLVGGKGSMVYVDCGPIEDEVALKELLNNADAVALAYDCADRATFDSVQSVWLDAVRACLGDRKAHIVLVGCKADTSRRQVSTRTAEALSARERVLLVETSAQDGSNIDLLTSLLLSQAALPSKTNGKVISGPRSPAKEEPAVGLGTKSSATLRIHRTGSVDLSSRASGVNLHLTRDGTLLPGQEEQLQRNVFPLLVDVKTSAGQLGTIIVRARDDDPLVLAEAFLEEHGMDKRRSRELASVVQRRLDEYFSGSRAPHNPQASPGLVASAAPVAQKKQPSPPKSEEQKDDRELTSRSFEQQQQPRQRPPPPPAEENSISPGAAAALPLSGKAPGAILARINVSVPPDLQTVVAVRHGDDASRVVEAFRRTYGLGRSDAVIHKLLDQVLHVLREGVSLEDTLLVEGAGEAVRPPLLPYADSPLATSHSQASRNRPSPDRLGSVPEEVPSFEEQRIRPRGAVLMEKHPLSSRIHAAEQQQQPLPVDARVVDARRRDDVVFVDSPIAPVQDESGWRASPQVRSPPSFHSRAGNYPQEQVVEEVVMSSPLNPPPPPPSKYGNKPSPVPYRSTGTTPQQLRGRAAPAVAQNRSPVRAAPVSQNSSPMRAAPVSRRTPSMPPSPARPSPASSYAVSPARPSPGSSSYGVSPARPSPVRPSSSSGRRVPQTRPLFYVDVNLGGKSERVAVHKGANLKEVAEEFLERNSVSKTKTLKLTQLLEYHMRLHMNKTRQRA